ncbi:MAG: zinc ribbon domain-containing protein [Nitrospiraceae bacterium]|nr:zinc ribbon domain-containing protein [Nitrospiraceae bacterium]
MPIYEYSCEACGAHHEITQKITDEPLSVCPSCKGTLKKMISSTSFVLKGTGWYATDYASKDKKSCGDSGSSASSAKPSKETVTAE